MFTTLFPATRWSLIGRLDGDEQARNWLVEHYIEGIARYLSMRMDYAQRDGLLDDVINEVALALMQNPQLTAQAAPAPGKRFRYFLMTVALNLGRNAYRRLSRGQRMLISTEHIDEAVSDAWQGVSTEDDMIRDMDRAWAIGILSQAWQDLSGLVEAGVLAEGIPGMLRSHLLNGQSLRELSEQHTMPLTTCQRRIAAGKHHLQRLLRERLSVSSETPAAGEDACSLLLEILGRSEGVQ